MVQRHVWCQEQKYSQPIGIAKCEILIETILWYPNGIIIVIIGVVVVIDRWQYGSNTVTIKVGAANHNSWMHIYYIVLIHFINNGMEELFTDIKEPVRLW